MKITISLSEERAHDLELAIRFLYAGCTEATARNPKGIKTFSEANMKVLGMTPERARKLAAVGQILKRKIENAKLINKQLNNN